MTLPALCFDATGTLIEMTATVGDVYGEIARNFGVDLPGWRLDDAFRRVMRHAPARGIHGDSPAIRREQEIAWWTERIRQTFQATDSTVRFENFASFAEALFETYRGPYRWQPRNGVVSTLETLTAGGYPMVVISNFDHRLPDILQGLDLESFFRSILIPSEIGARKPDRSLFELAAERLERPLTDLVYVGDDDSETLAEIRSHGLHVVDIESLQSFSMLPEWLASAATLPSS